MSQVYSTEPQTAGRVIFETTHGPLEIQLWCRECPSTTKYFLKLCLDGYYDNALFHRIIPNFLVQTGALRYDPVARKTTSQKAQVTSLQPKDWAEYRRHAGAEQALERRQFELNTRIRFNHRGQVAMALPVDAVGDEEELASLQPQISFILDEAPELDGKHVCFGTISGPTIFNAMRIGNTDVDEQNGQPTVIEESPRIERVKIMDNPIHTDLVPAPGELPWNVSVANGDTDSKKKKKKRKGIKNMNVLSFGDEMEQGLESGPARMKSSHDLVESKRLSKNVDKKVIAAISGKESADPYAEPRKAKNSKSDDRKSAVDFKTPLPEDGLIEPQIGASTDPNDNATTTQPSVSYAALSQRSKNVTSIADKLEEPTPQREKSRKISLVEARRAKYAKRGSKDKKKREEDTMAKFMAFKSKVSSNKGKDHRENGKLRDDGIATRMAIKSEKENDEVEDVQGRHAVTYHGQVLEEDETFSNSDWMQTKFKCRKHQDLDAKLGGDGRDAMEDYRVIDEKDREANRGEKRSHSKHPRHNSKKRNLQTT